MAQFQPPAVFTSGQVLTASALNAHVSSAVLLPGAVTDQTNLTANTVAAGDSVIIHDLSDLALKEATVGDLLNSGLNITTGAIAGKTGVDLVITPAAGQKVDVAGNLESNDFNAVGNVTIGGNLTVTGNFSGTINSSGNFTNSGTANFTGILQVNGTVGYVLTEVIEASISYTGTLSTGAWTPAFTSASYTKPTGEIWIIEVDYRFRFDAAVQLAIRLNQTTPSTILTGTFNVEGGATNYLHIENGIFRYVFQDAATFTSTFTLDFQPSLAGYTLTVGETTYPVGGVFTGVTLPVSVFRIYKYKTA